MECHWQRDDRCRDRIIVVLDERAGLCDNRRRRRVPWACRGGHVPLLGRAVWEVSFQSNKKELPYHLKKVISRL